jgi:hypothetical protein
VLTEKISAMAGVIRPIISSVTSAMPRGLNHITIIIVIIMRERERERERETY